MADWIKEKRRIGHFALRPHVCKTKWIENKDEEHKKKRRRNNKKSLIIIDDYLLVFQILSRLPAKSLMRFKCVCKGWKSIIEKDPHFIDLHRTHSQLRPGLLTVVINENKFNPERGCLDFLSADLRCDDDNDGGGDVHVRGASVHSVSKMSTPSVEVLGPVRGLICLVDELAVRIYNVSTGRAVTPWIKATMLMTRMHRLASQWRCQFGFDPNTGEHKVVFLWHGSNPFFTEPAVCSVLTVGADARWRTIDDVPPPMEPPPMDGEIGAYAGGSIYWISYRKNPFYSRLDPESTMTMMMTDSDDKYSQYLTVFDIGPEKFRVVEIPKFTFWGSSLPDIDLELMEMDGCLTMKRGIRDWSPRMVKMWKFNDYNKDENEKEWTEVSIELPCYISPLNDIYFHPVPGKDHMILETYDPPPGRIHSRNVKLACFYSYNMRNKTFSKFEIQRIPSLPEGSWTTCAILVENLFSVENIQTAPPASHPS